MKILALCGSLRKQSRSLALLQATANLAGNQFDFSIFDGLGDLPLFNPDIEASASVPPTVHRLWEAVNWSDAFIIASPEYAHGVTGTIKNALDWLVAYVPFTNKPVAVFNPSHRASIADEALKEILSTMNAQLITAACLRIPVTNCQLSAEDIASSDSHKEQILTALTAISAISEISEIFEHK